jgi:hypothetical protein
MVDQATLKSSNGRGVSPPRAVAKSAAELLHDVLTLAELQGQLLKVDCQSGLRKLIVPAICLAFGTVLALCCVPLALTAIALGLAETTALIHSQSFAIVLVGAAIVAAVLVIAAVTYLRHGWQMFDRSQTELARNLQWSKEMLKRLGRGATNPAHDTFTND